MRLAAVVGSPSTASRPLQPWPCPIQQVVLGVDGVRREFKDSNWTKAYESSTNLFCTKHITVLGSYAYVVRAVCLGCQSSCAVAVPSVTTSVLSVAQLPDIQTGVEFREEMYEHMNRTLPTTPPRRVLLYLRQGLENRRVYKVDMLIDIMKKLKVNYTYVVAVRDDAVILCTVLMARGGSA